MIAHIDLDIVVYSIASACDNKRYMFQGSEYQYIKDAKKQADLLKLPHSLITSFVTPEPLDNVKKTAVTFLEAIINLLGCGYKGYLSGKGNFRYDIATILPYKGNRSSFVKPYHYDNLRQFFVETYQAEMSSQMEADDLIGLNHNPEEDIIVTKDKDLNCIPGLHFNWSNNSCFYLFEHQADASFYCQLLTGDATDNILGIYGIGAKSDHLQTIKCMKGSREMFDYVVEIYKKHFGAYWKMFMTENARLLWIKQKRKPTWETYLCETD